MGRKIVQIAVTVETDDNFGYLYALADDGTLWFRSTNSHHKTNWLEMDGLPQPESLSTYPRPYKGSEKA